MIKRLAGSQRLAPNDVNQDLMDFSASCTGKNIDFFQYDRFDNSHYFCYRSISI